MSTATLTKAAQSVRGIFVMFLSTISPVTGNLLVQDRAAAEFTALGFTGQLTKDGRPRFVKPTQDAIDVLNEYIDNLPKASKIKKSFDAAGRDYDACIYYVGKATERGYSPTAARREAFNEIYPYGLTSDDDLDHCCHDDDCDIDLVTVGGEHIVVKKDPAAAPVDSCAHRMCLNPFHMAVADREENIGRSSGSRRTTTHCKAGHEYSYRKSGARYCATCECTSRAKRKAGIITRHKGTELHCGAGHERALHSKKDKQGQWYCNKCNTDRINEKAKAARRSKKKLK